MLARSHPRSGCTHDHDQRRDGRHRRVLPDAFAGYHLNGKRQISFTHAEILFERDWRAHHCQRSSAAINQHRWHAGGKKHARS